MKKPMAERGEPSHQSSHGAGGLLVPYNIQHATEIKAEYVASHWTALSSDRYPPLSCVLRRSCEYVLQAKLPSQYDLCRRGLTSYLFPVMLSYFNCVHVSWVLRLHKFYAAFHRSIAQTTQVKLSVGSCRFYVVRTRGRTLTSPPIQGS